MESSRLGSCIVRTAVSVSAAIRDRVRCSGTDGSGPAAGLPSYLPPSFPACALTHPSPRIGSFQPFATSPFSPFHFPPRRCLLSSPSSPPPPFVAHPDPLLSSLLLSSSLLKVAWRVLRGGGHRHCRNPRTRTTTDDNFLRAAASHQPAASGFFHRRRPPHTFRSRLRELRMRRCVGGEGVGPSRCFP